MAAEAPKDCGSCEHSTAKTRATALCRCAKLNVHVVKWTIEQSCPLPEVQMLQMAKGWTDEAGKTGSHG